MKNEIEKAQERIAAALVQKRLNVLQTTIERQYTDAEIEKAINDHDLIEKGGKKAVVGEQRTFGGKLYVKTATGWRLVKKGGGSSPSAPSAPSPAVPEGAGKVIGQTQSGKNVYQNLPANHKAYKDFDHNDHYDAHHLHQTLEQQSAKKDPSYFEPSEETVKHRQARRDHDEMHKRKWKKHVAAMSEDTSENGLPKGAGEVIGKTRNGKSVYENVPASHPVYKDFDAKDHWDAQQIHHKNFEKEYEKNPPAAYYQHDSRAQRHVDLFTSHEKAKHEAQEKQVKKFQAKMDDKSKIANTKDAGTVSGNDQAIDRQLIKHVHPYLESLGVKVKHNPSAETTELTTKSGKKVTIDHSPDEAVEDSLSKYKKVVEEHGGKMETGRHKGKHAVIYGHE